MRVTKHDKQGHTIT